MSYQTGNGQFANLLQAYGLDSFHWITFLLREVTGNILFLYNNWDGKLPDRKMTNHTVPVY